MRILLTNGEVVLIDASDEALIARWKWRRSKDGAKSTNRKAVLMHRVIMGAQPGECVDHINHNKLDNRKRNLRKCSHAENCRNQSVQTRSKHSKFKGVTLCKFSGRWKAQIKNEGRNLHLGRFDSQREAADAYNMAAKLLFGQFAFLNQ